MDKHYNTVRKNNHQYINNTCRPNLLLIIHGMNDENVHTSLLCDKLVEYAKPYQLQLYMDECHRLKSPTSMIHYDTTMLTFLYKNL